MATDTPDLVDAMFADASMHEPHGAWQMIFSVATLSAERGKGCAGKLIRQAISDSKERGREGLVLTCKDHLVGYYARFGFVDEGISSSEHGGVV